MSSSSSTGHGGAASSSGSGTTSSGPGGASSSTGGAGTSSAQSSGTGGQGGAPTGSSVSATGSGGSPSDGGTCPAFKSCAQQGFDCGLAPDGCGDTLFCGTCPAGQVCGAVTPNVCGTACAPKSCTDQGFNCGTATDGCGNTIDCGTCPAGQACGVTTPNVCGSTCTPKSCAQQGFNCGTAMDGCSNTIDCGTCPAGQTCGGTTPNVCACVGLCQQQQTCPGGGTTSISGTVYAPNGTDPLPGITVYVPNGGPAPTYGVQPFTPGVACQSCSAMVSGSPLVSTTSAADGTFTLTNMPVGTNIPLVIQKGRWRRQFVIPTVAACTSTALPTTGTNQIRLPQTQAEGDIPLMAVVTGAYDAIECMMRKIGVADSEFSNPKGTGRVRLYLGANYSGAQLDPATPSEAALWSTGAMDQYDMIFFGCQGGPYSRTAAQQNVLAYYANHGGRVFATHTEYVWLYNFAPFSGTAAWSVNQATTFASDPGTGLINTSFARSNLLAQWLQAIGATTTLGQIPIGGLRHDFDGVVAPSLLWLSVNDATAGNVPIHFTFDTPVGSAPASQCGRVLFTDFHVEDRHSDAQYGAQFPFECGTVTVTPQEKMVEYMIFDLDDCIAP